MTLSRLVPSLAAVALAAAVLAVPQAAFADTDATPTYEIKLDLGASALTSDNTPTAAVLAEFDLSDPQPRSYEYLDTAALDLHTAGWDVRVRHEQGGDITYNYKRRFAVSDGNVQAALDTAAADGFDASETNYDAEVDWGYSQQVLSFSDNKTESAKKLSGTSLPSSSTAIDTAVDDCPGMLQDNTNGKDWGTDTLADSQVYGPVTGMVWSGTWEGQDTTLEVVPIGSQTVVELTFDVDDATTAAQVHSDAITETNAQGWLLPENILKTDLILQDY